MKTLDTNPYLESIRAAYRKSSMYAKIHNESAPRDARLGEGPELLSGNSRKDSKPSHPAAADLPLGIPMDALEAELEERINP